MDYSNYSLDRLMEYPEYKDMCYRFLSLAQDASQKEKLESILYRGGYNGYNPYAGGKNNPRLDIQRRLNFAYMILKNPDTFDAIVEHNIQFFHGTNANALPGIVTEGIKTVDSLRREGKEIKSGEEWSRVRGKRDFVSFTNILEIAEGYSSLSPKGKYNEELDFPVVIGTTKDDMISARYKPIKTDVPEVIVEGTFPKESIKVIMVPSSKVDFVKKMSDPDTLVLANDDMGERFYAIDNDSFQIYIDEKEFSDFKAGLTHQEPELTGVKESVFSRTMSKVKEKIDRFKGLFKGDEVDNERRHSK